MFSIDEYPEVEIYKKLAEILGIKETNFSLAFRNERKLATIKDEKIEPSIHRKKKFGIG